jgi:hypothetical protein
MYIGDYQIVEGNCRKLPFLRPFVQWNHCNFLPRLGQCRFGLKNIDKTLHQGFLMDRTDEQLLCLKGMEITADTIFENGGSRDNEDS